MHQLTSFWWLCVKRSAKGNAAHANDWQWVFATPLWQSIGAAVGGVLGGYLSTVWKAAPAISPDTAWGVLLGGIAGFVITWLLAFLFKLPMAAAELYFEQKDRADRNEASKKKQNLLDEISDLYAEMTALRIDMEKNSIRLSGPDWMKKLEELRDKISAKITQFSSRAEAVAYLNVGNLQREINPVMGSFARPQHVDICIHDIDYLKRFIADHSRNRTVS